MKETSPTLPITVYLPDSMLYNPGQLLRGMFQDLLASRELAWRLAVRDISAQYRQTALGLLWAFVLPLANTCIWLFLSSSGIIKVSDTGVPYSVYVFAGTMLWSIFMEAANAPLQQTVAAKPILAKINFPREALIVSGVYQTLFNSGIKIAVLVPAIVMLGVQPGWSLAWFPLGVFSLILTGTALGLLVTPVGILYGDIGKSFPLIMQFLMYLTPVLFAIPASGVPAVILQTNPLTPLIQTTRDWLTGIPPEYLGYFIMVNLVATILLFVMWVIYRAAMPILIERMSA